MAISFLFNHAGVAATAIEHTGSGGTAAGYDSRKLMCGQRSTHWRSTNTSSNSIAYTYDTNVAITHVVVARADWLLTKVGQRVRGRQRSDLGVWSDMFAFDFNPLDASDLIGPRGQDLVVASTATDLRGLGISCVPATGTEASEISKLYGANAFSFTSADPSLGLKWQNYEPDTFQPSFRGTFEYEVERSFSLSFEGVTTSELESFKDSANLYHWPFFVYDPDQTIWKWKLEHVILGGIKEVAVNEMQHNLELQLFRLRHYD